MTATVWYVVSILLRAAATLVALRGYRRLEEPRFLILAGLASALLLLGLIDPVGTPLDASVGLGALVVAALATRLVGARVAALRRLHASEELHRLTLESVADAVFLTDEQGNLTHIWPSVFEFFGVDPGSVSLGDQAAALLGPHRVDLDPARSGTVTDTQIDFTAPRRPTRRLLVSVKRADFRPGTLLWCCRDITDRVTAQASLNEALEELKSLKARLEAETLYLQDELRSDHRVEGIIGSSPELKRMLKNVEMVAATDSTVLVRGETGSGKELVARAIHELSDRSERPLVKVNCAALPSSLIESELFGHEKGAFTGAAGRKVGRFELANEGTLFLDEVGELPMELQPKLLRALQESEFERVGGTETLTVDVRVIAATNRDLQEAVGEGRFRSDLYYRLAVFPLEVPPLRERRGDLLLLASHFLRESATKLGRSLEGFSGASLPVMEEYGWPGNVRELRNVVERAAIVTPSGPVDLVPFLDREAGGTRMSRTSVRLVDVERMHIRSVLDQTDWRIEGEGAAADLLGLAPSTLRSRLKKLGIDRP